MQLASDKPSSLLQTFVYYGCKKVYRIGPWDKEETEKHNWDKFKFYFLKFLSTKIGLSFKKFNLSLKLIKIDGGLLTGLSAPRPSAK
jgi:hypothetical protein